MINKIWFFLIIIGSIYGIFSGKEMGSVILGSASDAYDLIISLIPLIVLWSGILNIAYKSGLLKKFSEILRPFLKRLFPSVKNDKAFEYISSNVAANMIGLGSAATPAGLKAMEELEKENKSRDVASDAMITFLVLNTSGVTLLPMTVIALRMGFSSINATNIVIPGIIATLCSTTCGLSLDYLIRRKNDK